MKKVTKVGLRVLTGKALSAWLEFIDETDEKVFCLQYKLSVSLALLYSAELFINKLKTKFNSFFYRMVLNTKRIHNSFWQNFPERAQQLPSRDLFVGKKTLGHCAKIVIVSNS